MSHPSSRVKLLSTALLAGVLAAAATARAQLVGLADAAPTTTAPAATPRATAAKDQGPTVYRLTVRPQATTRPALRYRLLPEPAELTAGNAATMYLMALIQSGQVTETTRTFKAEDVAARERFTSKGLPVPESRDVTDYYLNEVPLDRLPQAEVDQYVGNFTGAFQSFDVATRREECRWELPGRELGFQLLLPHLSPAREMARVAALRARLRLARGDFEGAVRGLQGNFKLARDLNEEAFLIQALVGAGITSMSLERVRELVQQPGAPNLYWALADLPRPFTDVAGAMRGERTGLVATFPQLKRAESGRFDAEDWNDLVNRLTQWTGPNPTGPRPPSAEEALRPAVLGVMLYPRAKAYLLEQGVPQAEVDAMPVSLVLARSQLGEFNEWLDEMTKWSRLPYWQAAEGIRRTEQQFRSVRPDLPANPLLSTLPSIGRAVFVAARVDRDIAAVQTVDAIRAYAATHGGRPPGRLEDLTDTPAPLDPVTGKPFVYTVEGNRVTLESPAGLPGQRPSDGLRVEVTIVN